MFPEDNLTQEEHEELVQAIMDAQYYTAVTKTIILNVVIFIIFVALLVWIL